MPFLHRPIFYGVFCTRSAELALIPFLRGSFFGCSVYLREHCHRATAHWMDKRIENNIHKTATSGIRDSYPLYRSICIIFTLCNNTLICPWTMENEHTHSRPLASVLLCSWKIGSIVTRTKEQHGTGNLKLIKNRTIFIIEMATTMNGAEPWIKRLSIIIILQLK